MTTPILVLNIIFDVICPLKRWQASEISPTFAAERHWYVEPETRGQYEKQNQKWVFKEVYPFKCVQPRHINICRKI